MYDVKSYYNQAKNMVLNLSEMEAKVAEATNDDPWYVPMLQYQSYFHSKLTPGARPRHLCRRSRMGEFAEMSCA